MEVGDGARFEIEVTVGIVAAHQGRREPRRTDVADARGDVADPYPDAVVIAGIRIGRVNGHRVMQ